MRHRHDRDGDAREPPQLGGEHAAGVDDDLGLDVALVSRDTEHAALLDRDRRHARVRRDLRAVAARSFGEREGELRRVDVAVGGEIRRAEHTLGGHRREELLRLGRGDQLQREPEGLGPAGLACDFLEALLRGGQPQRPDLAPSRLEAHLGSDRPVELDARHHHLRQRERAAQLADEAGRVEGRARGQIGALDEDDVVPAEPRQPVENRAAADAAADHHRSRPVPHRTQNLTGCP